MSQRSPKKLTDSAVRKAKPKEVEFELLDASFPRGAAFGLRVNPGGTKSFFFRYLWKGKRKRKPLGQYPLTSLASARKRSGLNRVKA